jgi:proteasome activator subunit 4
MRYPLPRATRAALAKIYYQLIVSPGSEPRLLRGWVDMLGRLIPRKSGSRPKLTPNELELDWRSLWIILKKQVWASASDADDSL